MTAQPRPLPGRIHLFVIAALFALAAVVAAVWVLHGSKRLAGTDSVEPSGAVATVKPGQRLCVRDLVVPRDASSIRFELAPVATNPVDASVTVKTVAGASSSSTRAVTTLQYFDFPLRPGGRTSGATACLSSSGALNVWGFGALPATTRPQAFLDHKPLTAARVSVWFWNNHKRSLASLLPTAARRASVFRAGFVGAWTYLVILLVLPVLWWVGLRTLLRGIR